MNIFKRRMYEVVEKSTKHGFIFIHRCKSYFEAIKIFNKIKAKYKKFGDYYKNLEFQALICKKNNILERV